jgi:hypothetical protein
VNDQLKEADDLALGVAHRLETGELVSSVALAARRLAEMRGDVIHATWLEAEISGLDAPKRPPEGWSPEQQEGHRIFFRNRLASWVESLEELTSYLKRGEPLPKGNRGLYASLAELEIVASHKAEAGDMTTSEQANLQIQHLVTIGEARRIVALVRQRMHQWASATRTRVHTERFRTELLGPDAMTVFSAGGHLLAELSNAIDNLRPGMQATAAMQARTALLTLGRELYAGKTVHKSPISGVVHEVKGEKNALFAFLEDLWSRAGADRRPMIEKAIAVVDEAYDLGSKAKNPFAITYEEAETAVREVHAIAHAICFSGGFPPQVQ